PMERMVTIPDAPLEALARRQGRAAAELLRLGEAHEVWPLLKHSHDPGVRSYLIERLAAINADPVDLIRRYGGKPEISERPALLIALGDFRADQVKTSERTPFVAELLSVYETDSDPGLHSAIDWLLRQRWGEADAIKRIDGKLKAAAAEVAGEAR